MKGGHSVEFIGYKEYVRELLTQAGLVDPELEAIVDELKRVDDNMRKLERFFGSAGALVEA